MHQSRKVNISSLTLSHVPDHADVAIERPEESSGSRFVKKTFSGRCCTVYFDGGKETIGIVGVDFNNVVVFAEGNYSVDYDTNNLAELSAAKWAVEKALEWTWGCHYDYLKIVGDSLLVVKFLNKAFSPRRPEFYEMCV